MSDTAVLWFLVGLVAAYAGWVLWYDHRRRVAVRRDLEAARRYTRYLIENAARDEAAIDKLWRKP